jgi:hypothetical protein
MFDFPSFMGGALIISLFYLMVGYATEDSRYIKVAENGGFSIGDGILKQEWHCAEIKVFRTLDKAKEQVKLNQEGAGK